MTVRPHPTIKGGWQIDCRPDGIHGKRIREKFIGTRQEALDFEAVLMNKILDTDKVQHWTIAEAVPDFLDWSEVHHSLVTHADMTRSFKSRILPHFGKYQVRMLTPAIFDAFHAWIGKAKMVNNCQDYLRSLINWMVERKYAEQLTFRPARMKYHKPLYVPPSQSDIEQFLSALKGYRRIMATMIFTSGARWNEVANLRWENCNLDEGYAKLNESETERDRYIILDGECLQWLIDNKKDEGLCFPSPITGKAQKSITKAFQLATEKTGITIRTHLLRYAAGKNIYEATGDIYLTRDFMGHATVETTTKIYIHNDIERLQAAVKKAAVHVVNKKSKINKSKRIVIKG